MTDSAPDLRTALKRLLDAVLNYSPREDHDWRCEYRTAEVGYIKGGPPVIRCECGFDELGLATKGAQDALDADEATWRVDEKRLARAMAVASGDPVGKHPAWAQRAKMIAAEYARGGDAP